MFRTLTFKLALSFLCIGLISATLVGLFAMMFMTNQFGEFVSEDNRKGFQSDVLAYYEQHGSFAGIHDEFLRRGPPVLGSGPLPPGPPPFGLVNPSGIVLLPTPGYGVGDSISTAMLRDAEPLLVGNEMVGAIFMSDMVLPTSPLERQFVNGINRAMLLAMGGAGLVALLLSIVSASTVSRPLRALTDASRSIARGDLGQTVPIPSNDEVGKLAQAFNQMSSDLARAHELRRQTLADIAHDLRSPLGVLMAYSQALHAQGLPPSERIFGTMYSETVRMNRMIEDLRTLSIAEAGELELVPEPTAPGELVDAVVESFGTTALQKSVALHGYADAQLPTVDVDSDRMMQVLGNLVSNALRHTPSGGTIDVAAASENGSVLFSVQDTGEGIPTDQLPHVFERFYRGKKEMKGRAASGSGLGLAIVRSLVEAHGGTVAVQSEVGEGTRFTIDLPVKQI